MSHHSFPSFFLKNCSLFYYLLSKFYIHTMMIKKILMDKVVLFKKKYNIEKKINSMISLHACIIITLIPNHMRTNFAHFSSSSHSHTRKNTF